MARPLGSKKIEGSGRRAGTPNKRTASGVQMQLEARNYNVVEKILDDLPKLGTPEARIKVHLQLLEYCDARRKSVEYLEAENDFSNTSDLELLQMATEAVSFLREKTGVVE